MKTRWTTIRVTAIAAVILCTLPASGAWAGPPLSTDTFSPAYPSGPSYDAAVASLPGLGLLPDGKDDRCSTNGEADLVIVTATFNIVGAAEFVCEALPPAAQEICFAALSVAALANEAAGIAKAQCDFQDGLIDGAEIEAAFENTKIIHSDLGLHDDKLDTHDIEVQAKLDTLLVKVDTLLARQLEVVRLLHTPDGRRTSEVPACNGGPCTWNFR